MSPDWSTPCREDSIAHAARRFDYLYDTYLSGTNCRLYLSVIPDKNAFLASSHGYPALDCRAFTQSLRKKKTPLPHLSADRRSAVAGGLLPHRPPLAAGAADRRGCPPAGGWGPKPPAPSERRLCPPPHYGVYYGYAALPMEPDTIRYLTNDILRAAPSTTT